MITLLARAAVDGIPSARIEFATEWYGTRLHRHSLGDLCAAVDGCIQPGDAQRLENLKLTAAGGGRQVHIDVAATAMVTVMAHDAAWAMGKATQIRNILVFAKGSERQRTWRPTQLAAGAFLATFALLAIAVWLVPLPVDLPSAAAAAAVLAASTATGLVIGRRRSAKNRPLIWIGGVAPDEGWATWSIGDRIALAVGIFGSAATLLGSLAAVVG